MPQVGVFNTKGERVGELDLNERVFGAPIRENVLHEYVVMYQARKRRGTTSTKTRAEVSGGGRKPWRQKGTGRARVGSIRSPLWRHGGIVFGPKPRDYRYSLPKKVRRLAMISALSSKVKENKMIVLEELSLQQPKTKEMVIILQALNAQRKALVVTAEPDEFVNRAARNLPGVKHISVPGLNAYDLLTHDDLIITRQAVEKIEGVWDRA